jgi:hypothetical protein
MEQAEDGKAAFAPEAGLANDLLPVRIAVIGEEAPPSPFLAPVSRRADHDPRRLAGTILIQINRRRPIDGYDAAWV